MRLGPVFGPLAAPGGVVTERGAAKAAGGTTLSFGVIFTICVVAFVGTKVFLGVLLYWKWSRSRNVCHIQVSGGKLVMFQTSGKASPSSKAMLRKTETLSNKDIIGSGGFGTVYKLVLDDHSAYAVKKLARGGADHDRGFERELETLSDIKHRNLVTLRGYYSAPQVNLLVYDLMANGSLEDNLHNRLETEEPLDWPTRLNIAIGTARGIAYLHHDCIPHIIHRDIKASNILLDEDMEAHVADFGLAKLLSPDRTHVTTVMAGTFGYLAPEYIETGKATERGDVFSYGVVLVELITGRRPTDEIFVDSGLSLVQWVRLLNENGQVADWFDDELVDSASEEQLAEAIDIACQCLSPSPKLRPSMLQVLKLLERLQAKYDDNYPYPESERGSAPSQNLGLGELAD